MSGTLSGVGVSAQPGRRTGSVKSSLGRQTRQWREHGCALCLFSAQLFPASVQHSGRTDAQCRDTQEPGDPHQPGKSTARLTAAACRNKEVRPVRVINGVHSF